MIKEFIPHQQASQLKELGFDEPCLAFYWNTGKFYTTVKHIKKTNQATITPIQHQHHYKQLNDFSGFKTYEETELECLKKLIEIVNDK